MSEIIITVAGETRPATAEEIKQLQKDWADEAAYKKRKDDEAKAQEEKRIAAIAKLNALGLELDDLEALGLG